MKAFLKLALGRSFESALSDFTAIFGTFLAFLTIAYTRNDLTNSQIFSTLEFILFLKISTGMAALGIGFLYELEVVFKRFATIMDLRTIRMINIDTINADKLN